MNAKKQDRQCTHNVTISRIRATIFALKKHQIFHILSECLYFYLSSMHNSCNLLYYLWPVWLYYIYIIL